MTTPDQDSFNTSADNDQEAAPLDEKSATGGDLAQQPAGTTVSSGEPEQLIAEQDQTPHIFGDELASDKAIVAAGDAASFNGLDHTDQNTDAPQDISAESLLELWQPRLQTWAEQGELLDAATVALHLDQNQPPPPQLTGIVERLKQGHTTDIPTIELLEQAAIPSAAGAYAASKRTIYLNRNWVNTASETDTVRVLTEEFGHHLDALIQTVDTPGDEGRQLSDLLTGNNGTDGQNHHNQLKSQGQIEIDGELIDVEFSTLNNSLEWIQVGDEINGVARSERAGWAVSLSEDGTILAVGSPYDDMGSDFNANHGSVKIYQDVNGAWQQLGSEIEGTSIKGIRGHSVSLSNDGTRVAVVTRFGDSGSLTNCGRVNIYQFTNGDWSQLDNSILGAHNNGRIDDAALSGDGNYVILGSANKYSGYAEVYQHNSTSNAWEQVGSRLTGVRTPDRFGYAVDISDDGNIIAVGSYGFDNNGVVNTGAVRVYEFTNGDWSEIDEIVGDKKTDQLGFSVSLSSDGTYVAAGARCHDVGNNQTSNEGYARVYQRNGSTYSQIGETIVGEQVEGRVGTKVSLSSNGLRLAVGAGQHDFPGKTNAGQVKLYELQSGTWNQIGSDINGENQTDVTAKYHGLSLNGDGTRVAIGAHNNDNFLSNSGQVRIFDSSGITLTQTGDTDGSDLLTSEAGTSSSFTVVLDAQPTGTVTVAISGLNSAEGSLSADSLSFSPSNWDTPQTITVTGVDDAIADGDTTTTLTATASNDGGYAGTESAATTVKNTDDDTNGITLTQTGDTDGSDLLTSEAGTSSSFTVVLDAQPTGTVTVAISGLNSAEGSLSADSLSFSPSNWDTPQTITVTGVDDAIADGDTTTTLTATASNDGGYAGTESAATTVKNTDDDTNGITLTQTGDTDGSDLLTSEAGTSSSFTVVLDAQPTGTVTVAISGLNSAEGSLSADSLSFSPSNWDTPQTITITGVDDAIADGDTTTTLTATASNDGGYAGTESAATTVKNTDDDTNGITLTQTGDTDGSDLLTSEAGTSSSFTVVLDAQPTGTVTVAISGLNSAEGSLSADSLSFSPSNWDTPQTITITGVDDAIVDGDTTTTLTATASNDGGYAGTESAATTVKNTDDDTNGITLTQTGDTDGSDLLTSEAGTSSSFTVVLDAQPTGTVTVAISGLNSAEGSLSADSLSFSPSNWDTPQTITITGVDDAIADGDTTTTLTATASNDGGYAGTESAATTVKNTDDDTNGITLTQTGDTDGSDLLTSEAGTSSSFTVVLDAQPTGTVTVAISGLNSAEGSLSADSLSFSPSNWDTPQTITVTGVDDAIADGDTTTTLTATASNDGGYAGTESAATTVKNTDDDTNGITLTQTGDTDGSDLLTSEAGTSSSFTVVLDAKPTGTVTVAISGLNSAEGSLSADSLSFSPSNWDTPQTITVTGVDDAIADGDTTTTLTATASNDGGYAGTESATTTVKNTDDDTNGITITQTGDTDGSDLLTSEAGTSSSFTVVLDAQPTGTVTVAISGLNSAEGSLSADSLSFSPSNWDTPQTITVTGVDDAIVDGDTITTLTATASNDGGYAGTESATTTVKNTDDDTNGITLTQTGDTDGSDLLTSEAGTSSSFTVVLDNKPTSTVTVTISGLNSAEGSLSADSLSFSPSNWDTPQTITVTGVDDAIADGDTTTTLTATASNDGGYAGTESATTTVKNTDDDTNGITLTQTGDTDGSDLLTSEAGTSSSFTVVLDAQPTGTVTVAISGLNSAEGSLSADSLSFSPSNWDTPQTITITGVDDAIVDGDTTTTLTATASNDGGYAGTESATTTVKNTDDDTNGITLTQTGDTDGSDLLTSEAGTSSSFTVVLDAQPTGTVTVAISGLNSEEGSLSADSLSFSPSNWDTPQTITVTGVDDAIADGDTTTTLTATASNDGGYAGTESAATTVKNTDDDTNGITLTQTGDTDGSDLLTSEAGTSSSFTVVLDAQPTGTVTVAISGLNSAEGSLSADSLSFSPSNWDTPQTITVTGVDDAIVDGDTTTTLTATASNDGGYAGTESAATTVKNTDDDTNGITISQTGDTDGSDLLTSEAGTSSSFTVVLDAQPTGTVTVAISGLNSAEGSLSADSLSFSPSNWDTPQTITVTGVDDAIADGDTTTTLTATASNDGGYAGTESAATTVKNTDDDSTGITLTQTGDTDGSDLLTSEAGTSSSFTVVLDAQPTGTVTVAISGLNSAEGSLSADSLSFSPSNWDTPQTITVTGVDDAIADGDTTTTLTATASNDGGYAGTESAATTVKNTDDDSTGITITQTGDTDGSDLLTSEAGTSSSFTVVLDAQPTGTVTVAISGLNSEEGSLSADSLSFSPSNWDTPQTITITGVDDAIVDGDTTTTLTATASNDGGYAGTESATTTVKNTDDDNPPSLSNQDIYVLETVSDDTELLDLEDANTNNDTDEDGDPITYSILDGNDANLFTVDSASGQIQLASGKTFDYSTSDRHTLEITATSTGGTSTAEINVHIINVNNSPVAVDDSGSLYENETLSATESEGLIVNDNDEDVDDILTISSFHVGFSDTDSPRYGQFNTALDGVYGQLTLQTDGSYTYTANKASADALNTGETGTDTFSYTLSDSEDTDQAELTITLTGVNDNPFLVDAIKTKKYIEGQGNIIVIDGSLDIRDVDDTNIESASVSINNSTFVSTEDQLAFNDDYGIIGSWNSSTGVLSLSGSATKSNYVNALQTVTYTNTNNDDPVIGTRTIEWLVNDGDSDSTSIQSSIIVGGRNDAPLAINDSTSVSGGSIVSTTTEDNLLANDSDPESHSLSIKSFRLGSEQSTSPEFLAGNTLTGTYGQMTIEADGTYSYSAQESAAYKLLDGETAIETFTYTITDSQTVDEGIDTGEITITISGINDAPTAIDDSVEVDEDSSKQFADFLGILKNDTDVDGDQLFIKGVRTGSTTNRLRAKSLESSGLNTELQGTYGVLVVNSNGSFRYTASLADALDEGDKEVDRFTYTLTDLTNDDSAEMEIEVTGINDTPILSSITDGTITDQTNSSSLQTSNISGQLSATDADASAVLTYGISGVSGSSASGIYGTLTLNSTTGIYQYLPKNTVIEALNAGENVSDSFEIYVTDGSQLATRTFQINIIGANDANNEASNNNSNTDANNSNVVTENQSYGLTIVASGVINDDGQLVTTEDGGSSSFTVVLNREPNDNVNVSISGLDSTEGRLNTDTLRFTRSNWNIPQTVTVTGIDDLLSDGTTTYNLTATANKAGGYSGTEAATITISNIDQSNPQPSELVANSDGQSFKVTGDTGLWVQLEVLQANADLHNSLQIIDDQGEAIGSIGATRNSTNMGTHEIFLSGGSEWFFHQMSHDSKLNESPSLRIHSGLDDFILHLDDSKNGDNDHDDLSIKITTSEHAQNPVAAELASQQRNIYDPILNLSKINTPVATVRMTIESDCADTSRLGLVKLTGDENKGFTVNGISSAAGESFDQAVRDNLINPGNTELLVGGLSTSQAEWSLNQNQEGFYAPVFINKNSNDLFTFGATSARDNQIHVKNLGSNFFGYEDRLSSQNSDWDFNDITVKVELL